MKILIGLFALFSIFNSVFSQEAYSGNCTQFGNTQLIPFYQESYMGLWYIHGLYDYSEIAGRDCLASLYYGASRPSNILERSKDLQTMEWKEIKGLLTFDKGGAGTYAYRNPDDDVTNSRIDIIATDYKHYAIEWSCWPNDDESTGCTSYLWIMSRYRTIPCDFWEKVDPILRKHRISKTNLRYPNQDEELCSD